MTYTKEISFRDLTIEFDYNLQQGHQALVLEAWRAFDGPNEVALPCAVEVQFIERQLYKWLDEEFSEKAQNYVDNYLDGLAERRYDNYVEV